jgi:hypothetical protein
MHRTSCGPSGTHSRSRGDALAHRMPCGHDTSSIQRSTPSTNQEPVHGSKGPLPHRNELETPQTPPNRPWDPPGSHLDENRLERSCLDVGRSPIRLNPSGGLSRHPYTSRLVVTSCRMDLPGPTTLVGTRTDYSVGPWDYPTCATRHLKAWSTRTAKE